MHSLGNFERGACILQPQRKQIRLAKESLVVPLHFSVRNTVDLPTNEIRYARTIKIERQVKSVGSLNACWCRLWWRQRSAGAVAMVTLLLSTGITHTQICII